MLKNPEIDDERLGLGLVLTFIQVVTYFSFIFASCFAPDVMRARLPSFGIPLSFMYGAVVIAMGIVLTIIYVVITNKRG